MNNEHCFVQRKIVCGILKEQYHKTKQAVNSKRQSI